VRAPGRALTIRICRIWRERSAHTAGPYRFPTDSSLMLDGHDLLCAMRLAPTISLDFSRSKSRGMSDLHSPNDAWTSQTHAVPDTARSARHDRSVVAFPSERHLSSRSDRSLGVSPADQRYWPAACDTMHRHSRSARRCAGPDIPPGERRWDSEASSEAAGRHERTALMSGYGTFGLSSSHAGSAIGRLTPRSWETADAAKWVSRREHC
jgi:hypothetical protein